MAVPYTFATATSAIPLSQLDSNFATTITLGNTAIQLGNTVTTLNNMTLANVTISSGGSFTSNSISTSGNLTFTGTGNRILGDFSNATVSSRTIFQTSTANSSTGIYALPSGTSTAASWQATNNSDPTNASKILIATNGSTDVQLVSGINGSGTYLPMTFYNNGSEKMRLDTSGNLGIGTSSPTKRLTVANTTDTTTVGNNAVMTVQAGEGATINSVAEIGFAYRTFSGTNPICTVGYQLTSNAGVGAGALTFSTRSVTTDTAPSERMRIDSSGNVGIGTTTPAQKLHVASNGGGILASASSGQQAQVYVAANGATAGSTSLDLIQDSSNVGYVWQRANQPLLFATNGTERMRIDTSGNLLVGTTTATVAANGISGVAIDGRALNSSFGLGINSTNSTSIQYFVIFGRGGSACGSITSSTTNSTSYTTSSDYRLKENVQPMVGALDTVLQLKPCTYDWKIDGSAGQGFIAHELQEVVPDAVVGEKDAVDEDGNIKPQGVDTSFLVATLTAAIQEQQAMIEELKAELDVCKAEIAALKGAK